MTGRTPGSGGRPRTRGAPPARAGRRPPARPGQDAAGGWVFGRRSAAEALAAGRALRVLMAAGARGLQGLQDAAAAASVPVEEVPRGRLDALTAGRLPHQGVAAWVDSPGAVDLDDLLAGAARGAEPPLLVVAAHLQDPRNLGAIARTAEAAGAQGLVVPRRRAAPLTPVAERAAAGALAHLPVAAVDSVAAALDRCRRAGLWVFGADPGGRRLYSDVDLTVPLALVVGAEGPGMPRLVRERCDELLRLPMRGRVASLNAAVAAGIILYESVRQRTAPPGRRPEESHPMG